ncbi:class I SAM-dependent methyltransferase [uncultured Corynebacterium sp.]|uniref:class I SAM-dependent methyltransferase n=1 Tax=uncultured Corynebacterium sp. TaxID=159447 RepID=UPI0025F63EE5|nr:class I SAM-dependent methyltransferase [uncultured Corynebacterium sp.]
MESFIGYGRVDDVESVRANRSWWDSDADDYHREHPLYLGEGRPDGDFVWCPEMLREEEVCLLGDAEVLASSAVLEIGCGSAPCSRWLAAHRPPASLTAFDVSMGMLAHGVRAGTGASQSRGPGGPESGPRSDDRGLRMPAGVNLVQADAAAMPFRDGAFDIAFSVFGAIPFVADTAGLMRDVARVLRPGGRFVFSVTHPMRWCFPDDPGPAGLKAGIPYFHREAYVERDETGDAIYVEHHRTMGDRIRELVGAGFVLDDVIEPEWPDDLDVTWGQWSPLRGAVIPGTAIFVARRAE